jgi:hypothetical protein
MHKGRTAETRYYYQVYAVNGEVRTDTSHPTIPATKSAVTGKAVKPVAPIGLVSEDAYDASQQEEGVLLLWSAPADPAGASLVSYQVQRKIMGKDDDFKTTEAAVTAGKTDYTDRLNRPVDQVRYYRIAAENSVGVSVWSDAVRIPAHNHPHEPRELTDPLEVTEDDAAAGTATIRWQPISGATSYHVAVIVDTEYTLVSGTYTEITDLTDREHIFTGLASGTPYIFAVIGEMSDGTYSGLAFQRMTLE